MKKNTIKRTIEEVVRVEYIADDGTVFYDEAECRKYEESALFAVSKRLKRLTNRWTSQEALLGNCQDEDELEIFDVQTEEDLEVLRRYLYLKALKNGATEKSIQGGFTADGDCRKSFVFDNVTIGHEVLIFWNYDNDWFWVYNDGSLEGYFRWIREKYTKLIASQKEDK